MIAIGIFIILQIIKIVWKNIENNRWYKAMLEVKWFDSIYQHHKRLQVYLESFNFVILQSIICSYIINNKL